MAGYGNDRAWNDRVNNWTFSISSFAPGIRHINKLRISMWRDTHNNKIL